MPRKPLKDIHRTSDAIVSYYLLFIPPLLSISFAILESAIFVLRGKVNLKSSCEFLLQWQIAQDVSFQLEWMLGSKLGNAAVVDPAAIGDHLGALGKHLGTGSTPDE
jgi:hypothetical protein